ncbi:hypothetical protein SOVF_100350 isoform B, partial [Spinacia oleracea]
PEINHKKLNLEPETSSVNNKEETDGFETASEGDHSDRGTDFGDDEQQQQEKFAPLTAVKDDSYEDALDDDQLKQSQRMAWGLKELQWGGRTTTRFNIPSRLTSSSRHSEESNQHNEEASLPA